MSNEIQSSQPGRRSFLQRSALALVPAALLMNSNMAEATVNRVQSTDKRGGGPRTPQAPRTVAVETKRVFVSIQKHENDHVTFLLAALGSKARPKPRFQGLVQKSYEDFVVVSQALENTGVGAYLNAAPAICDPGLLAAAASIATVEARHAGVLNVFRNSPVTVNNESFDTPLTADEVTAAAGAFIADLRKGPPLTYSDAPSLENDIAILNFALALEFLEAEFYNVNIPKFFR